MKLATQVRYGTRMLLDLAMNQSKGMVQMGDIAARQNISLKYLEQLIMPIKNAGFVKSKRGPKGGHCLARKPEQITLAQIIRVFDKADTPGKAKQELSNCSQYQDLLIREAWGAATKAFYSKLESITLADLSIGTTKKLWKSSDLLIFTEK
jgi:Rrf2 family iron-sulfur cluster assembly transcriptional regulator